MGRGGFSLAETTGRFSRKAAWRVALFFNLKAACQPGGARTILEQRRG
jgi:hypothetical protein